MSWSTGSPHPGHKPQKGFVNRFSCSEVTVFDDMTMLQSLTQRLPTVERAFAWSKSEGR